MNNLDTSRMLVFFCWIHVPLLAVVTWSVGVPVVMPVAVSAALSLLATIDVRLSMARGSITLACALIAQPMIMVAVLADHPWQIDMHMYFFAMMAILSLLASIPALFAATAIVAVHHLSFNFFLPELVYPGGSDLWRTIVHAVILVVETVGLSLMVHLRQKQERMSLDAARVSNELAEAAEQAKMEQAEDASRISMAFDMASESIEVVDRSSEHVRDLTDNIAAGANQQSESVQFASEAVQKMAENLRQSAENALETERISKRAAERANSAGHTVNDAVSAMQTIAEKIDVVQEIARQTDLLALNAAVEAARAGEHGKGFAVVASEVRKLAERSRSAASEISELSQKTMTVSSEAGEMLTALVPEINRTADLVGSISEATREQSVGTEHIQTAVTELDEVIALYGRLTSEAAIAASDLASSAKTLSEVMAQQNQVQTSVLAEEGVVTQAA